MKNIHRKESHGFSIQSLCDAADILRGGGYWASLAFYECQKVIHGTRFLRGCYPTQCHQKTDRMRLSSEPAAKIGK